MQNLFSLVTQVRKTGQKAHVEDPPDKKKPSATPGWFSTQAMLAAALSGIIRKALIATNKSGLCSLSINSSTSCWAAITQGHKKMGREESGSRQKWHPQTLFTTQLIAATSIPALLPCYSLPGFKTPASFTSPPSLMPCTLRPGQTA